MPRTSLQELPCPVADAVLVACFDPASLSNRIRDCGGEPPADLTSIYSAAHRLLHRRADFAPRLERILDRLHADRVVQVAQTEGDLLLCWCRVAANQPMPSFGGILYALARDPRPVVQRAVAQLVAAITRSAFRCPTPSSKTLT